MNPILRLFFPIAKILWSTAPNRILAQTPASPISAAQTTQAVAFYLYI
jgi:hypothetical protein